VRGTLVDYLPDEVVETRDSRNHSSAARSGPGATSCAPANDSILMFLNPAPRSADATAW
jgi:hypothetical protein